MQDDLKHFFRTVQADGRWTLEVGRVVWNGPHTPGTEWKVFRTWKTAPSEERLAAAMDDAFRDERFFAVCSLCQELNNCGHLHSRMDGHANVCHGCAERKLGVVH